MNDKTEEEEKTIETSDNEETEDTDEVKEGNSAEKLTWIVEDLTTQTEPVIYNNKNKKVYTTQQAIVELLNRTEK